MMPPPIHLADCVVPDDPWLDEEPFHGIVKCSCSGTRFNLLYVGQLRINGDRAVVTQVQNDGAWYYVIRASCPKCGKRHVLYDKDYHGWNGFVAYDVEQRRRPRPADAEFRCLKCNGDMHRIRLHILSEGRADFIDQSMGNENSQFEEGDWPNAFGSISFDIICVGCDLQTSDWAGDESM